MNLHLISSHLFQKFSTENHSDTVKLPIGCFLPLKIVEYFIVKVTFSASHLSTEYNPWWVGPMTSTITWKLSQIFRSSPLLLEITHLYPLRKLVYNTKLAESQNLSICHIIRWGCRNIISGTECIRNPSIMYLHMPCIITNNPINTEIIAQ